MALLVKATGETAVVEVPKGKEQLEFLQKLVGGFIELARLGNKSEARKQKFRNLICNEEGKMDGLPYNEKATQFAGYVTDFLVGDILFVKAREVR